MMETLDNQGASVDITDPSSKSNEGAAIEDHTERILPMPEPPAPLPRAAILQHTAVDAKLYWDRSHYSSPADQMKALEQSSTVYVGNLSFTIKSHHVHHHFTTLLSSSSSNGTSSFAIIKRVILGIDRGQQKPCGFCFVELFHRSDAIRAVSMISGTQLDGKVIRVELDAGFQPGRQLGRGKSGGQVRDDKRNDSMKRYRDDGDERFGATAFAHQQQQSERPVRLDEALPSTRNHGDQILMNQSTTNYNNTEATTHSTTNQKDNEDDEQPSAKRIKLE